MPHFQPRPLVVIRNQLLAFLVLHLLGSCVPMQGAEPQQTVAVACCSNPLKAAPALPVHWQLRAVQPHSR